MVATKPLEDRLVRLKHRALVGKGGLLQQFCVKLVENGNMDEIQDSLNSWVIAPPWKRKKRQDTFTSTVFLNVPLLRPCSWHRR